MSVERAHRAASAPKPERDRPVVVHVTTTDMSLELLLGPQLEAMAAAGYDVVGLSAPGPYVEALIDRGVRHVPLVHATRSMSPLRDLRLLGELWTVLRRLRPDIVHTHNPKPGLLGRIAARVARVPIVVNTVHGLYATADDRLTKRTVVYGLERIAAACSDAELVQNPEDLELLRRLHVPDGRLELLGNGVDLCRFDPARFDAAQVDAARAELGARDRRDIVIGAVGRLVREKGYPELFEAARRLARTERNLRFAVIGPSDPEKADGLTPGDLANARTAGVRLLGERSDVAPLYAGMDLFVLASHREGYPRAAMEAAAMGLPIVATDVRGCRQVVDDRRTGVLIPRADPEALASAIARLASDEQLRARMGVAARARALEHFDDRRCIDLTLATYARLAESRTMRSDAERRP